MLCQVWMWNALIHDDCALTVGVGELVEAIGRCGRNTGAAWPAATTY